MYSQISDCAAQHNIEILELGIQPEHIHALILLHSDQTIQIIAGQLKGESSHWINVNKLIPIHFEWQDGYSAFSISGSHIDAVRLYIRDQDEHHYKKTFKEEYEEVPGKYGFISNDHSST